MYAVYVRKPDGLYMVDGPHRTRDECEIAFWEIRNHFYHELEIHSLKEVMGIVCRLH